MAQEHKEIKFHSIYYRFHLFIMAACTSVVYGISNSDTYIGWGKHREIITVGNLCLILNIVFVVILIGCSFIGWKLSVCNDGIYLKKIDLFVRWSEIAGVSHVWMDYLQLGRGSHIYNRKTIVIYRKGYKPICVYNISLFALWAVKFYAPQIKNNLISATAATVVNVILNGAILYFAYGLDLSLKFFNIYSIWAVLYMIKIFVIPLIMVKGQNRIWGPYLYHATAYQRNSSDVINI